MARVGLAPMDPNAYLAWIWRSVASKHRPLNVLTFSVWAEMSHEDSHKYLVGQAARMRKRQRLQRLGYST